MKPQDHPGKLKLGRNVRGSNPFAALLTFQELRVQLAEEGAQALKAGFQWAYFDQVPMIERPSKVCPNDEQDRTDSTPFDNATDELSLNSFP